MPVHLWARNFTIEKTDVETLTNLLLEKETPLSTEMLTRALIEYRLAREAQQLQERFKDTVPYNPSLSYNVGQKLVFPQLEYATAEVVEQRTGNNEDYGAFNVIRVRFDDDRTREFAASLTTPHKLNQSSLNPANPFTNTEAFTVDDVMNAARDLLMQQVEAALKSSPELVMLTGLWFPRDLLMDVNVGHLNLAEAVLDMMSGGPLTPQEILEQIGGIGDASLTLQIFSLNYAMRDDKRFDEVGATGEVLWFLSRLEPQEVLQMPTYLRYTPAEYDRALLSVDMLALEAEIGDELSTLGETPVGPTATITLNYPHRRAGTLPLTPPLRAIFPTARKTSRVWIRVIDNQDGEEFTGWVVRNDSYVLGFADFYRKHKMPVGAFLTLSREPNSSTVRLDFNAHRARTEYIPLIVPKNDQVSFENHKRQIGADYDELMILGIEDLTGVDALFQQWRSKTIVGILKLILPGLSRLTPQGTVHAKTIYSVFNVLRRCPPGPIFAALVANPEFQNVGGHYWKMLEA